MTETATAPVTAPAASTPPPATSTPSAQQSPATATGTAPAGQPVSFSSFVTDKGTFKPGWTKSFENVPETLEKFTTAEGLVKSYVNLERAYGSNNKVAIPGEHATPEEKAEFFNRIGRPEKPEGYEIKMPDKVGDKPFPKELWSDERAKTFATKAHELGLTKAQAQALVEYQAANGLGDFESVTGAQARAQADADAALRAKWPGQMYDTKLALAQKAAVQAGGEKILSNPKLANDPDVIEMLANVGGMIVENPAAGARGTSSVQSDPKAEIAKMESDMMAQGDKHPLHPKHPDPRARADAVERRNKLYQLAYPETKA
jgi:hypothetical protein